MQLKNCSPNACPLNTPIGLHADHPPHSASRDVPTVLGMMTYISMQTHLEIWTAVNMIAKYAHDLHQSSQTDRTKGTATKECSHVDADFASMCGHEDSKDPSSAKSRTGYIIYLFGCPIAWNPHSTVLLPSAFWKANSRLCGKGIPCFEHRHG